MKKINPIFKSVAPSLNSALQGNFQEIAMDFIAKNTSGNSEKNLNDYFKSSEGLHRIKELDKKFSKELDILGVDPKFLVEEVAEVAIKKEKNYEMNSSNVKKTTPQVVISLIFILFYFSMVIAIFFVEIDDNLNMEKGENSMLDELQILLGVMTAGLGQILSYWFGAFLGK